MLLVEGQITLKKCTKAKDHDFFVIFYFLVIFCVLPSFFKEIFMRFFYDFLL